MLNLDDLHATITTQSISDDALGMACDLNDNLVTMESEWKEPTPSGSMLEEGTKADLNIFCIIFLVTMKYLFCLWKPVVVEGHFY